MHPFWHMNKSVQTQKISGSKHPEDNQPEETSSDSSANKNKGKPKGKARQRVKKPTESPTFKTSLTTPIEDIIEETLQEEDTNSKQSGTSNEQTKRDKSKKKPSNAGLAEEDNPNYLLGYSFFKSKTASLEQFKQEQPKEQSKSVSKRNQEKQPVSAYNSLSEEVGLLLFPVKEKARKSRPGKSLLEKQNSDETIQVIVEQGIVKKTDLSRPSIIEHYKKRSRSGSSTKKETFQPIHQSLSANRIEIETSWQKVEPKESKKVTAGISFANIVTNKIPDSLITKPKKSSNLDREDSSSFEILSSHSENHDNLVDLHVGNNFDKDFTCVLNGVKQTRDLIEERNQIENSRFNGGEILSKDLDFDKSIEIITCVQSDYSSEIDPRFNSGENFEYIENPRTYFVETNGKFSNNHLVEDFEVRKQKPKNNYNVNEYLDDSGEAFFGKLTNPLERNTELFLEGERHVVDITNKENFEKILDFETAEECQYLSNGFVKEPVVFEENSTRSSETNHFENCENTEPCLQKEEQLSLENLCTGIFKEPVLSYEEVTEPFGFSDVNPATVNTEKLLPNIENQLLLEQPNFEVTEQNSNTNLGQGILDFISSEIQHSVGVCIPNNGEDTQSTESAKKFVHSEKNVIIKPETEEEPQIVFKTNLEAKLKELEQQIRGVLVSDIESKNSELESEVKYYVIKDNFVEKTAYVTTDKEEAFNKSNCFNLDDQIVQDAQLLGLNESHISSKTYPENHVLKDDIQYSSYIEPQLKTKDLSQNSKEVSEDFEMTQIRVLTLNDKEHQESTIYRVKKSWILQFRLGPSLLGYKIRLYCNYPKDGAEFERGTYQLLAWCQDEGCKNADDTALSAQITPNISGSFHYYCVCENENVEERQGSGYFLVDPALKFGSGEDLPLDSIQCQTVLAKHLGPFSTWENKLRVTKESGYNMIHFSPIQELGSSKSCYSLCEQLKLNSMFDGEDGKKTSFEDVEKFIDRMRKEWKVLSVCDIVLNHTANESVWIKEHPEATYNCVNCPYMRPAYLLDAALHQFSLDIKKGLYEDRGIPIEICTEDHLNAIRYHFKTNVLNPLKIEELFIVDTNKTVSDFLSLARKSPPIAENNKKKTGELLIIQDSEFKRMASSVDLQLALTLYNVYRVDTFDEDARLKKCSEDVKIKLDSLNRAVISELYADLDVAIENVIAGIRYFRVQHDGPKVQDITIQNPLVPRYFTDYGTPKSLGDHENIMYSPNGKYLMAHNGWVMDADPLNNFADRGSKVYIRREMIAWGDSVKLRYGDKPEDCPILWDHMKKYVDQTAKIFDGVRLDNCHSTPIPVAEYLLDSARRIRPDLYVVAELFTQSDMLDNIFVNSLGITSLIREAMSAWDSHEEGRLVYRYGGVPVGSFYQPSVKPLVPMVAHALFLDLTHDNPSPVEKRSVFDLLPSTALVNMACCASGSNRGYDELVPHHIHVVEETRQYTEWTDDANLAVGNSRYVTDKFGIIAAKKAINDLHFKLGNEGFNQVYVDQMDIDVVAVTRHNPDTHLSYVLVAYTAFGHPDTNSDHYQKEIKPLRVEGVLEEIVLEASLSHVGVKSGSSKFSKFKNFVKDPTWINGLSEYIVSLKQHIHVEQSDFFEKANSGTENVIQLNFKNFKPGSVAVIKVSLPPDMKESIKKVRDLIKDFSVSKDTELKQIVNKLTLADLNRTLYRCEQEEKDEGYGFDAYNIPNFGSTVYCGLQGFVSLLANIRPNNDLGHPMCVNLRNGNWMIEYIWKRLKVDEGTKELGRWIEENTKPLKNIPRYLIPRYFDVIVTGLYVTLLEQCYNLMSDLGKNGSTFVRGLALGSVQMGAYIKSADLPVLSPNLDPPKPPNRKNQNGTVVQACITLSAGLPHFSVGYMRNWGRDTFITLRGLFILTGRYDEARQHILGYAACLRHGLIPNLLDGGRNPRFNCRDAVWWWLYCIKSYCEEAPNGLNILQDKVSRIFPTDDSPAQPAGAVDQPLYDVIQEALKVHFQGLKFRERNAGRQIDEQMVDAGFNNQIGIHPETGFVFGGNRWNCGTWMDKMGSSEKAGNKGKPATPRDGSAVELVGLSKAAISWLWKLNQEGRYPYDGVERTHKNGAINKWTFQEWASKIQKNFENKFFVSNNPSCDEERPDLVNKKDIYKDSFGASQQWADYQLRCNFPIAMVTSPELFNHQKAWAALKQAEKYLLGPLGMKTLDPEDWNYRGDYDNSNDSDDYNTAHGLNYHQGPEWIWPIGFFLRAKLIFASQNGMLQETIANTKVILAKHFTELQTSPWRGLPELTNSNGSYCHDSSRTQAWSMGCVLEVLHDLQQIEAKQIIVN